MHFAYNSNFQGKDIKKNIYMQVFTHSHLRMGALTSAR